MRERVRNRFTVLPFTAAELERRVYEASRASPATSPVASPAAAAGARTGAGTGAGTSGGGVPQVQYLARYCQALGARTVVIEDHYIDRHFLDEFAFYYCRALSPPANHVRRFHLFKTVFDKTGLRRRIADVVRQGGGGDREDTGESATVGPTKGDTLERGYLGFVSVRPIPAVPIGRTVLRRLNDGEPREIWATGSQKVHLANLQLEVDGLAFQQQDLAVGACATAALWSALSRVARMEHMRSPTPAEVSDAAGRHLLASGRVVPAVAGLTIQQLCEAVRACGFAPEYVGADRNEIFVATLHAYLLSGIPVVLTLRRRFEGRDEGHAVTAVGFRSEAVADPLLDSTVRLRSARVQKLYVHDDRIGPYARAFLKAVAAGATWKESLLLDIEVDRSKSPAEVENWVVVGALVPVYPKLRLSVRSLLSLAEAMAEMMEGVVGEQRAPRLSVELFYRRAGEYVGGLRGRVDAARAAVALPQLALSRWCAVVRWFVDDIPLVDFLYDTTDILRDPSDFGGTLLRAIVCLHEQFAPVAEQLGKHFDVPWA